MARKKYPPWTPEEDAMVLTMDAKAAAEKLNRTIGAVHTHRYKLLHPEPKPTHMRRWTAQESNRLRARFPTSAKTADLLALFPGFTVSQLKSRARYLGLKKVFCGDSDVPIEGHFELVDQIRLRAKQDGIPLGKIDRLLKLPGKYFKENWKRQRRVNLRAVARAIEFFGGTLVIDWRDR
jgi:hypothetical protein